MIERALILSRGPLWRIDEQILGSQVSSAASPPASLKELECLNILQTLTLTDWHIEGTEGAVVRLGVPSQK